jgi:L-iditol 2-dehydrogenase
MKNAESMNALQVRHPRAFEVVKLPVPHLGSGPTKRILVRTSWVSMCGSDIPFFTGDNRRMTYPLAPGAHAHECIGQVVESTSGLFHPGDLVAAIPDSDLGLAEFFVAHESKAVHLPAELADCDASTLIQPLSTVVNAVDRIGNVQGVSAAVVGLGSIGLLFCWLLQKRGAGTIVGIDPCAYRCHVAMQMGATGTLPMRGIEVVHAVHETPNGWISPEVCIEAVGHQHETLNNCIDLVREAGIVVAFGVPDDPVYPIEFETFFRKNAHLTAVVTPDWSRYLQEALNLFLSCRHELAGLATHRFPIHEAGRAFTLYARHEDGFLKAVLDASCWQPDGW